MSVLLQTITPAVSAVAGVSGNTKSDRRVSRRRRNTCYLLVSIQDHLSCYYLLALFHCAAGVSAGASVACFLP